MERIRSSRTPVMMQLYVILDDPEQSQRDESTQFVMEGHDTIEDAIEFLNENMASRLWGVSRVELLGIVSLNNCEDRNLRPRKVLPSFPLDRIFVPNHQDCLVVIPEHSHNDSLHTDNSTDYPTSATGRFNMDPTSDEETTATDDDDIEVSGDGDGMGAPLPRHLMAEVEAISDNEEGESLTPLTGLERIDSERRNGDDETTMEDSPTSTDAVPTATSEVLLATAAAITASCSSSCSSVGGGLDAHVSIEGGSTAPLLGNRAEKELMYRALAAEVDVKIDETVEGSEEEDSQKSSHGTTDEHEECNASVRHEIMTQVKANIDGMPTIGDVVDDESHDSSSTNEPVIPTTTATKSEPPPWVEKHVNTDNVDTNTDAIPTRASAAPKTAIQSSTLTNAVVTSDDVTKEGAAQQHILTTATSGTTGNVALVTAAAERTVPTDVTTEVGGPAKATNSEDCANDEVYHKAGQAVKVPQREDSDGHHAGPNVVAMVSLFDNEIQSESATNEDILVTTESPTEMPMLTTIAPEDIDRELSPNADLVVTKKAVKENDGNDGPLEHVIQQNLKYSYGNEFRRWHAEFESTGEHESVNTTEFADEYDLRTASSFDNVVVVDLPKDGTDTKESNLCDAKDTEFSDQTEVVPSPANVVEIQQSQIAPNATDGDAVVAGAHQDGAVQVVAVSTNDDFIPTKPKITGGGVTDNVTGVAYEDSWQTDSTQEDLEDSTDSFRPLRQPEMNHPVNQRVASHHAKAPAAFPSLLGSDGGQSWENSDTEVNLFVPSRPPEVPRTRRSSGRRAQGERCSTSYKIGSTYFLLRARDNIEYPVKILSLGKRGTCIVEYEHHRAKKKIRTSSLLPDTPERRQKFREQMETGEIANDLPARISKELRERQTGRNARHEDRRLYGHHISRDSLPSCSTEGTVLEFKSRRVYFAKDRETIGEISKKFNVPSERIVYDNKIAYPTLKKTSKLRPLTSIVLPPA